VSILYQFQTIYNTSLLFYLIYHRRNLSHHPLSQDRCPLHCFGISSVIITTSGSPTNGNYKAVREDQSVRIKMQLFFLPLPLIRAKNFQENPGSNECCQPPPGKPIYPICDQIPCGGNNDPDCSESQCYCGCASNGRAK